MTEVAFWNGLFVGWSLLATLVSAVLFHIHAPYGRHTRTGWGPTIRLIFNSPRTYPQTCCKQNQ